MTSIFFNHEIMQPLDSPEVLFYYHFFAQLFFHHLSILGYYKRVWYIEDMNFYFSFSVSLWLVSYIFRTETASSPNKCFSKEI